MRVFIYKFLVAALLLNALTVVAVADALDNWTPGNVSTNNEEGSPGYVLSGIAYGNGRYVAVGEYFMDDYGVIETSDDGTNWTMRSQYGGSVLNLYSVTYANGVFVASGWDYYSGNNLYSSPDGVNWTSHTTQIANVDAVTYGAGLFVAVGDGLLLNSYVRTNKNIYTSSDGVHWLARSSGAPVNDVQPLSNIAYGDGKFVAVGAGESDFFTSASGIAWTMTPSSFALSGNISFCNGLFFAPIGPGTNLVSPDGITWSVLTNNTSSTFGQIIYTNGLYVALSSFGAIGQNPPGTSSSPVFSSTDGTNWVQHLEIPSNNNLFSLSFGGRNLVAVGYESNNSTYIGTAFISDPFVAARINPGFPPQVKISGVQGLSYDIQYSISINPASWQTVTNLTLSNSPSVWVDTSSTNSQRFYRVGLLP